MSRSANCVSEPRHLQQHRFQQNNIRTMPEKGLEDPLPQE